MTERPAPQDLPIARNSWAALEQDPRISAPQQRQDLFCEVVTSGIRSGILVYLAQYNSRRKSEILEFITATRDYYKSPGEAAYLVRTQLPPSLIAEYEDSIGLTRFGKEIAKAVQFTWSNCQALDLIPADALGFVDRKTRRDDGTIVTSAQTKIAILLSLAASDTTVARLAQAGDRDGSNITFYHLRPLAKKGLVEIKTHDAAGGEILRRYHLVGQPDFEKEWPAYVTHNRDGERHHTADTTRIKTTLQELLKEGNDKFTIKAVTKRALELFPDSLVTQRKVSAILYYLQEVGILEDESPFGKKELSIVFLTPKGKEFVTGTLIPILGWVHDLNIAPQIRGMRLPDADFAMRIIEKHQTTSPFSRTRLPITTRIIEAVAQSGSLLQAKVAQVVNISPSYTSQRVKELSKSGRIVINADPQTRRRKLIALPSS